MAGIGLHGIRGADSFYAIALTSLPLLSWITSFSKMASSAPVTYSSQQEGKGRMGEEDLSLPLRTTSHDISLVLI
jgi:hypothetical protein